MATSCGQSSNQTCGASKANVATYYEVNKKSKVSVL